MTTITTPSQRIVSRPPRMLLAGSVAASEAALVVDSTELTARKFAIIAAAIRDGHIKVQINEIQDCETVEAHIF